MCLFSQFEAQPLNIPFPVNPYPTHNIPSQNSLIIDKSAHKFIHGIAIIMPFDVWIHITIDARVPL